MTAILTSWPSTAGQEEDMVPMDLMGTACERAAVQVVEENATVVRRLNEIPQMQGNVEFMQQKVWFTKLITYWFRQQAYVRYTRRGATSANRNRPICIHGATCPVCFGQVSALL